MLARVESKEIFLRLVPSLAVVCLKAAAEFLSD